MKNVGWGISGGLILGILYGVLSGFFLGFSISLIIGISAVFIALISTLFLNYHDNQDNTTNKENKLFILTLVSTALGFYFAHFGSCSGESCGYATLFNWMIVGFIFSILIIISFVISVVSHFKNKEEDNNTVGEGSSKNAKWILVIVVALLIILVAVWFLQFAGANECTKIASQSGKDYCFKGLAERNKDSSLCEKVVLKDNKNQCYNNLAQTMNDINLCTKVVDQYNTAVYCYGYVGADPRICEQVRDSDNRLECYKVRGVSRGNESICQVMSDTSKISDCVNFVSNSMAKGKRDYSLSKCKSVEWEGTDWCYVGEARFNNDITLCDYIKADYPKQYCLDQFKPK